MRPASAPPLTILLHHPDAETYARLIRERFPDVDAVVAPDMERLEQHIGKADALLAFRFPVHVIDQATRLRWFQCTGAGVDSIFPIRDRVGHITVTNARGIHGEIIADYVMAGVTMLSWDFRGLLRDQEARRWAPRCVEPLADKTIGIVGLGSIGATIARRAKSAGMTVLGVKRDVSVRVDGVDRIFATPDLPMLLPLCDFVVLAVPATNETIGLMGAAEFSAMRPGAYLVNIARGNVVVEAELIRALETGAIAGALLDVFEQEPLSAGNPLWGMPQVIATPHVSGSPTNYADRVFAILAENIERFLLGKSLRNVVDLDRGY